MYGYDRRDKLIEVLELTRTPYRFITCDSCPIAHLCSNAYEPGNVDGTCSRSLEE